MAVFCPLITSGGKGCGLSALHAVAVTDTTKRTVSKIVSIFLTLLSDYMILSPFIKSSFASILLETVIKLIFSPLTILQILISKIIMNFFTSTSKTFQLDCRSLSKIINYL
jgi:hypothetical protein